MGEAELLMPRSPSRLWLVEPPRPAGGELTGPPPDSDAPQRLHQWQERVAALDDHPGQWIRWEYSDANQATKARSRYITKTDPDLYEFATRRIAGTSWLYGIRRADTLFDTPDDHTEITTCKEPSR